MFWKLLPRCLFLKPAENHDLLIFRLRSYFVWAQNIVCYFQEVTPVERFGNECSDKYFDLSRTK
jgi:hypothetical protein